jgi:hypothetical protein
VAGLSLCAVLGACGDADSEAKDAAGSPPSGDPAQVTSDDATGDPDDRCAEVISDPVVALLGWSDTGTAVTSAGRCERGASGDTVTVGADETVRPDAGADVQAAYDAACQTLSTDGPGAAEQDPSWLDGASACVVGPQDGATAGFFEFYTVSEGGWLVHGQLAQSTEAETDDLKAAIAKLVTQASASDWG